MDEIIEKQYAKLDRLEGLADEYEKKMEKKFESLEQQYWTRQKEIYEFEQKCMKNLLQVKLQSMLPQILNVDN